MAEEYARRVAAVAAGQLAELAGFEGVQESSAEILADLMLRYMEEVAAGASGYAEMSGRSEINVLDVLVSLDRLNVGVDELRDYHDSLDPDDNTFAHAIAPFPVRMPARVMPTFEQRGEAPPPHIPPFLPAFPDAHTFEHTPAFPGHEQAPAKQTEVVQQQRRAADKALLSLYKRAKTEQDAAAGGNKAGDAAAAAAGAAGPAAGAAADAAPRNLYLSPPELEVAASMRGRGSAGASPMVAVPETVLLSAHPHHIVVDQELVVRVVGPELSPAMPHLLGTKLGSAFKLVHPSGNSALSPQLLLRDPYRVFVVEPLETSSTAPPVSQLQLHAVSTYMQLDTLSGATQQQEQGQAAERHTAPGSRSGADGAAVAQPVLLLLARPRTLSDEQLKAADEACNAAGQGRAARAHGAAGPEVELAALEADEVDAAFRVLVGADASDRDVAWNASRAFEASGSLKPTYDAGFSQDWTTKTKRAALAVASRKRQEDAYAQQR